jgi:hypothetical protein
MVRAVDSIAAQPTGSLAHCLCVAAERRLDAAGVGLAVAGSEDLLEPIAATVGAEDGESLQTDLGEGPSYTACRAGRPVLVPDVDLDDTWPAFGPAASALGLRGVFAFPLRQGALHLGALTVYRDLVGHLSDDQHADGLVYARLALDFMGHPPDVTLPDGPTAAFPDDTIDTVEIHQAAGVVSVQLDVTVSAALTVLRARAFADGQSLRELANDVIARRIRLDDG